VTNAAVADAHGLDFVSLSSVLPPTH
jgi:hypothetical protein